MCDRFYVDLQKFKNLTYSNYEIIIVPNKGSQVDVQIPGVRVIIPKKKNISLGEKRDIGWQAAKGKYCAYIDDDAYPKESWLTNALKVFNSDLKIGAVGGPNLTPPDESFWSQIGGLIYTSYLTSGQQQYRFVPVRRYTDKELQGVNMIIRTSILKKLGGFENKLNSGDDTKICSDIKKTGYKVISDPSVIVYHHRRSFPVAHLRQIHSMGKHRGYFIRIYPETNAAIYFAPFGLTIGFFIGLFASIAWAPIRLPFLTIFCAFFLLGVFSLKRYAPIHMAIIGSLGIIATHIWYGISFIEGFLTKTMEH